MRYKLVIFDFDGTIADTSSGIIDSHKYVLHKIGKITPSDKELFGLIGGNLLNIYIEHFGFNEDIARELVRMYRKRYLQVGIHKARLYPGFEKILISLKEQGIKIGIATLKSENFAKIMVEELGISKYFDCICGMDINDGLSKAILIKKCMDITGIKPNESILVGDTFGDYEGASKEDVDFLGVTYGFGFNKTFKYDFICCDTCDAVEKYFCDI